MPSETNTRSPWEGWLTPGSDGGVAFDTDRSITIEPLAACSLVQIVARKGALARLRRRLKPVVEAPIPCKPLSAVAGNGVTLCATGPVEFWAMGQGGAGEDLGDRLAEALGDLASLFDQSHGRACIRLKGACVAEVLAKGCPVDLHPSALPVPGGCQTVIEGASVLILRTKDHCDIAISRSYAGSFAHWLTGAAAEFGYQVVARNGGG